MPDEAPIHTLSVKGLAEETRVVHFSGYEGISQLFEFSVSISAAEAIAFDDVVGNPALLSIRPDKTEEVRHVSAVVKRFEQLNPGFNHYLYRAVLVPKVWMLQYRMDNRIFQELDATKVIKKVLEGAGLAAGDDFKMSLQATYTPREYCVQYRESDWDFVCRLMEEEGIYYFFQHGEDGHVLHLVDKKAAHTSIEGTASLPFRQAQGALGIQEHGGYVTRFAIAQEVRPGKVTLRDFNFKKPALSLEAEKAGAKHADLEIYDYPGDYDAPGDGATIATLRHEELQVASKIADADSTNAHLLPGYLFSLAEHPREDFNAQYMVTRVEHWGTDPSADDVTDKGTTSYRNQFEVIPAGVQFRPPFITRRPQIHGVQTAIVVGPSGEEIYTDEHGRVKVQFHWDRLGKNDDKSSCWIRVSQLWAGVGFGAMFLPRVKDEVVVTFLEGDPDRPLIVGRVYHGTNVPPYSLPSEKTKSTIKTKSSPSAEGFNELRFEDKKGSEEIFVHAQKDWTIKTENDKNQKTVHDETLEVGNDRTKEVKNDQKEKVGNDNTLEVVHDQKETIGNDETLEVKNDRKVTVDNDHTEAVKGKQELSVTKEQTLTVGDKQDIAVTKTRTLKVDGDVTETFGAKLTQKVTGDVAVSSDGMRAEKVRGDQTTDIGGKHSLKITGDFIEEVTGKKSVKVTSDITIESGSGKLKISPSGEITIEGVQISIKASGPLKVHGVTVDVKSDGPATVKAPMVSIEAEAINKIKGVMVVVDGAIVNIG